MVTAVPSRLLKKVLADDRDSLAPTRFGDGACAAATIRTGELFSYVHLEARVRRDHPLRAIRTIVNEALSALEREFAGLYSPIGRPSIPPEKLLRMMLLQAFYSIRSERLLMERLEHDLLFRWFVGIGVNDAAGDHSVFSKNRDRLLEGDFSAGQPRWRVNEKTVPTIAAPAQ
jgi:transposase